VADLHGVSTDNAALQALLDTGNRLRYGMTEGQRVERVNRLAAPGVRDVAYRGRGYNHPAAERYTSAHAFGTKWKPPAWLQRVLHEISGGSRELMHQAGVPGVGEEDPDLAAAEELGMAQGAGTVTPQERARIEESRVVRSFLRGLGNK
jgi:hypothetical protein